MNLFIGMLFILFFWCSPAGAAELVISTENTPDHPQAQFLDRFAQTIAPALMPHSLILKHSADAVRGRDEAEALTTARIAFAAPGLWNLDAHQPDLNALLLPSLMGRDRNTLAGLVDGPLGALLNRKLMQSLDVVVIGRWLDLGPVHVFTVSRPVSRFADLRGLRIRYAGGAMNEMLLKALGAVPVLVPWPDVPEVLRSGRVDGILTTASTVVSGRLWQSGLQHGFLAGISYSFFIPMASRSVWTRLTPAQQAAVHAGWDDAVDAGREEARTSQDQAQQQLREAGMSLQSPSAGDLAATRAMLVVQQPAFIAAVGISADVQAAVPGGE